MVGTVGLIWETDFAGATDDPRGAGRAFAEKLDASGIRDDEGREVELWAGCAPQEPTKVVVGVHETPLTCGEVLELVLDVILDAERRARESLA